MINSWKYLVGLCLFFLISFVICEDTIAEEVKRAVTKNEQIINPPKEILAEPSTNERETQKENDDTPRIITEDEQEGEVQSEAKVEKDEKPLPESLTLKNFDRVMSDGLHFVEFFSPYCGHCKALAPIWKQLYQEFSDEAKKMNLYLHQVDCVENGDLCAREAIKFYPAIRLYVPNDKGTGGKLLSSFPTSYERTVEGFSDYLREAAGDFNDDGEIDIDSLKPTGESSSSPPEIKFLDANQLLNAISGKIAKPLLVSFWSSGDEDLNTKNFLTDPISNPFYDDCSRCFDFRNIWLKVNKLLSPAQHDGQLELGIVNCKANKKICTSLGMHDLVNNYEKGNFDPKVFMFLPSDEGGNKIRFKSGIIAAKRIVNWSKRLLDIYKFEDITMKSMTQKKRVSTRIPNGADQISETPIEPSITFVYYYDKDAHVAEDDLILKHLLQPIMDSIFNVYLYKSSDPAVLKTIKKQDDSMIKFIENGLRTIPNESEALPDAKATGETKKTGPLINADEELFAARTLSNAPMLVCFKDYSYSSYVFQSFGTEDSRDYNQVIQFIKKNSIPSLFEMTDFNKREVFPASFNFNDAIHDKSEKVLITFVDSNEVMASFPDFYYMSYVQQSYEYMKYLYQFSKLKLKREQKQQIVQDLKDKDSDTADIIKALRMKISNVFNQQGNLINVYLDINKFKYFKNYFRWNDIEVKDYKAGDTLLVSRFKNEYWETPKTQQKALNAGPKDESNPVYTKLQVSNTKELRDLIFESSFKVIPPLFPPSSDKEEDEDTNTKVKKAPKSKLRSTKLSSSSIVPKFIRNGGIYTNFVLIMFAVLILGFYRKYKHSLKIKSDRLKALGILGLTSSDNTSAGGVSGGNSNGGNAVGKFD